MQYRRAQGESRVMRHRPNTALLDRSSRRFGPWFLWVLGSALVTVGIGLQCGTPQQQSIVSATAKQTHRWYGGGPATLRQKVAQLLLVGFEGSGPQLSATLRQTLAADGLGGVLFFEKETDAQGQTVPRNIVSPSQVKALVHSFTISSNTPLLFAIDQEGGRVMRLREPFGFHDRRSAKILGQGLADETFSMSTEMARRLAGYGFNLNMAPVVDLAVNPDNPVIALQERSFGADASSVIRHARAFVRGHRRCGVETVLKHFPGHGSSTLDTHASVVDISDTWQAEEWVPYQSLIGSGDASAVMLGHLRLASLDARRPASLSKKAVQVLREKLGFDGLIISDDLQMKAIQQDYSLVEAMVLALDAGVDMIVLSRTGESLPLPSILDTLEKEIERGTLSVSQINAAFRRVVAYKSKRREQCS